MVLRPRRTTKGLPRSRRWPWPSLAALDDCDTGSYFVSTYPPFSCWNAAEVPLWESALADPLPDSGALGLYVHVPFCAVRCSYCYYLSHANPSATLVERYVDCLLRELDGYAGAAQTGGRALDFVYVGGGTPSLLPAPLIRRLLSGIRSRFELAPAAEVTFECAPQSAQPERLAALSEHGVTRLSMGVQQLDDDVLEANGRIHRVADVERAWASVCATGFDVVNLDLIVGMVGETEETFFGSLGRVVAMAPDSVTIYQLEVPHNTPLYKSLLQGRSGAPPSWQVKRDRLESAFAMLELEGYVVRSSYAAVRDPVAHRFVYQEAQYRGADLVGIGASSFSYVGGVHHQNVASLRRYLERVEAGRMPYGRAHALTHDERLVRELVLQLKLGEVRAARFRGKFGVAIREVFADPFARFAREGLLTVDEDGVHLTRKGLLRVDEMIPAFYLEEHKNVRYS